MLLASVLLAVAPLAGCVATAPAPAVVEGGFASVEDLKAAYEATGAECPEWAQTDAITLASESGDCDGDTVLSIYASDENRDQAVDDLTSLSESIGGATFLVGPNWIINDADAVALQKELGGTVVDTK